ncbi:protein lin-37 homolog [Acanthaster planci]|uniref:Protein lin-37 homolog n=1 Tax=Acanthaster planci TaxID=133434 RepID=A0A8B7ZWA6_ACAPL|nr:protein lin-37 homolog [Acanthaster planci]XP_022109045.1 protein lin-37 homolog [Acanthaster planci]XP_022109046.1 protein lin-37 homolog [Acanthaster planci]XP_022109047.1 protein lin-37 homolog [Acanthaster planci]XP_022109049.1 protein lin-37 homolog [Acanthaster planci]
MSGRGKHHHPHQLQQEDKEKSSMASPRSKLEGVLQNLVEKADEESSPAEIELIPVVKTEVEPDSEPAEAPSPSKRQVSRSRKRRKRELPPSQVDSDLLDAARLQHSYVMKLFDRSVDLAQFRSTSSLYPVCREWMLNRPAGQRANRERSQSPEPLDDSDDNSGGHPNYYHLPRPTKLASYVREETGQDPRIPLPMPNDEKLETYLDSTQDPSREELLRKNMNRWKKIRNAWKSSAQYNQARYNESYEILKAMYERQ